MAKKRKFISAKAVPAAAAAAGGSSEPKDRISELPDEVLHDILRRIGRPKQAAKCIALSRRWRSVWRSYPVLEFNETKCRRRNSLEKFGEASIEKFSRHNRFAIESLDITIRGSPCLFGESPVLQQLLELASERKAEHVKITVRRLRICLPYRLLSNSGAITLQLSGIYLYNFWYPLALNSLQKLVIYAVGFENEKSLTSLIAGCPLLKTLEIRCVVLTELKVSNVPNLKYLDIHYIYSSIEIEIDAPRLEMLNVSYTNSTELVLVAHRLERLEMLGVNLSGRRLQDVISKLPSLKSLALSGFMRVGKELNLKLSSSPNLEEVKLSETNKLDCIVLDAGPALSRFHLVGEDNIPTRLVKCEINNADACRWEVDVAWTTDEDDKTHELMHVGFTKRILARFPQFQTLSIRLLDEHKITFKEEEADDQSMHPIVISHLKLCTDLCLKRDQEAVLEAVFWICRPKFFTIIHEASSWKAKRFFATLLNLMSDKRHSSKKRGVKKYGKWRDQLKDVKITTRDVDRRGGEEKEELMDVSTDMPAAGKRISFMLTWH